MFCYNKGAQDYIVKLFPKTLDVHLHNLRKKNVQKGTPY